MLKKLYQKDGNIIIHPPEMKFGYYIINHLKDKISSFDEYKKGYYESKGFIYSSHLKDLHSL